MRQDQFEALQALQERLMDVFLAEADPTSWPGNGIPLGQMDAKTRGDVYWVRKTAAAVLVLEQKIDNRINLHQVGGTGTTPATGDDGEKQLDAELSGDHKEAEKLLRELMQAGPGKKQFDRKVHAR